MPYLAIGQQNTRHHLALLAVDATGHLYNPAQVTFRIIRVSDSAQVFPSVGEEDVTDFGADTGVFPAWDTAMDLGWTPDSGDPTGEHEIQWTFRDVDDAADLTWSQRFFVAASGLGLPFWTYISPNEVRAEGITATDLPDARLLALILRCQQYIERICRQPFRPVPALLKMDGLHADSIFLAVPILGVEHLKINDSVQILDQRAYRVYNSPILGQNAGWLPEDHRRNPRIRLSTASEASPVFWSPGGGPHYITGKFVSGVQNQEVKGAFGYLEPDGTTPILIREAMLRLVYANSTPLEVGSGSSSSSPVPAGPITSETTDRHSITYADTTSGGGAASASALATSSEVEEILRLFKPPIGIASPTPFWTY